MTLIILVLQGGYGPGKWYHSEGPYSESSRRYECVFFYVDGLYRENVTFEIQYEMNNAAMRYGNCSELYLSFFSMAKVTLSATSSFSSNSFAFNLSFNSNINLCAVLAPIPGNCLIFATSLLIIAKAKLDGAMFDKIQIADFAPLNRSTRKAPLRDNGRSNIHAQSPFLSVVTLFRTGHGLF